MNDSITDDIREIRHDLAAQCGNDVVAILADARRREASDGRVYITLPKRLDRSVVTEQSVPPKQLSGST